MKKTTLITNIGFVGFLFSFFVLHLLTPDQSFSEDENRVLSALPDVSVQSILSGETARDLEIYIQDQFPLRSSFVELKTRTDTLFQKNYINDVYISSDTLLIGLDSYNENRLNSNLEFIERFASTSQIPVDLIVIPTAAHIYPSKLPEYNLELNQNHLLNEIQLALPSVSLIHVNDALASAQEYLYYRTDHHLNVLGSNTVYQAYMQALEQPIYDFSFQEVSSSFTGSLSSKSGAFWISKDTIYQPISTQDLTFEVRYTLEDVTYDSLYVEDNLTLKDQYTYFLNGNQPLVEISTNQPDKENILIITDSYGHNFAPFITQNYNQVTFVDLRYYHQPVSELAQDYDRILIYYGIDTLLSDANVSFLK